MRFVQVRVAWTCVVLMSVVISAVAEPRPSYSSLTSPAGQQLTDIESFKGQKVELFNSDLSASAHYFIWDLQYVRLPDGTVAVMTYEYQREDDQVFAVEAELSDFPPGTIRVNSVADVFGEEVFVGTDLEGYIVASWGNPVDLSVDADGQEYTLSTYDEEPEPGFCQMVLAVDCLPGSCASCEQTGGFGPLCACTSSEAVACGGFVQDFSCQATGCSSCIAPACTCYDG
ncbi:MAG: hypothetical protein AAF533_28770 [Acidobacteriota bacterium]